MKISEAFRAGWEDLMKQGNGHWAKRLTAEMELFKMDMGSNEEWFNYCSEQLYGCLNSSEIKKYGITNEQIQKAVKNGFVRQVENFNKYNRGKSSEYQISFTKKGIQMMVKKYDWNPNNI